MENLLKEFVIGANIIVVLPFYLAVQNLNKNYSYESYTIIAPIYLGFMNIFSGYLQKRFELTNRERYIYISLISPIIVILFAYLTKSYLFNTEQWIEYSILIVLLHLFVFNFIVYNLDKIFV